MRTSGFGDSVLENGILGHDEFVIVGLFSAFKVDWDIDGAT